MTAASGDSDDTQMRQLLVAVGASQDIEAFEALFRHFAPRVKAYMAQGSRERAEELMQETMMTVWRKASQYDAARGTAASWIYTIARNRRIDAFRRDRRAEFDVNDPAFVPDAPLDADIVMSDREQATEVQFALADLPPDQAQVLVMAYYEDKSQSDIADLLKVPLGTVKSRMRLGFAKLRSAIGKGDRS